MKIKKVIIGVTIGIIAAILWSVVFINVLNSMAGIGIGICLGISFGISFGISGSLIFSKKDKDIWKCYFSGFSTLNFVLSTMDGMALRENDIGYARFLLGKVQAVAHILEMGKYNGIRQCLILYVQGKM